MNNNLKKLEYDKILEKIAHFCKTYLGKKYAFNLRPSQDVQEVQKSLQLYLFLFFDNTPKFIFIHL